MNYIILIKVPSLRLTTVTLDCREREHNHVTLIPLLARSTISDHCDWYRRKPVPASGNDLYKGAYCTVYQSNILSISNLLQSNDDGKKEEVEEVETVCVAALITTKMI